MKISRLTLFALFIGSCLLSSSGFADTPADLLQTYQQQAKAENRSFAGFNAARGQQFFSTKHGNDWSCSSCHTANPTQPGKHQITGRSILPMAPVANPERFTSLAKTEKWFKRNCKDVLSRECTAQEKGDFLSYLLSIK